MAVHDFPGVSASDLAHRLVVTFRHASVPTDGPPGYAIYLEEERGKFLVKDGQVAIICGGEGHKADFGIFHFYK